MFTTNASKMRKSTLGKGRTLVLIDFENLCAGTLDSIDLAKAVRQELVACAGLSGNEQVVIATSHAGLLTFGIAWPGARLLVRSGENGADLELLSVLDEERVGDRFDRVVLASGDGIFAEAVARLGSATAVTVIARPAQMSRQLRMAAHRHLYLEDIQTQIGEVA
ncbi:MAG: hypothetical protein RLZZ600_290 [Actinomycetota bacterium]|jgi:hypothetical protein